MGTGRSTSGASVTDSLWQRHQTVFNVPWNLFNNDKSLKPPYFLDLVPDITIRSVHDLIVSAVGVTSFFFNKVDTLFCRKPSVYVGQREEITAQNDVHLYQLCPETETEKETLWPRSSVFTKSFLLIFSFGPAVLDVCEHFLLCIPAEKRGNLRIGQSNWKPHTVHIQTRYSKFTSMCNN